MDVYQLDTNTLLRFLVNNKPVFTSKAKTFFKAAQKGQFEVVLCEPIFQEIFVILRNYYKFPKDKITSILQTILSLNWLTIENREIVSLAVELYGKFFLDIADCLLLSRSKLLGQRIFTFDSRLSLLASPQKKAD